MKLIPLGINGPYPSPTGACSGYLLVSDSGTKVLIDCGTGVLSRLTRFISVDEIDGIVLSHLHYDHMSDMLPMQYALQFSGRTKAIPVIAPERPANVRALLACVYFDIYAPGDFDIGDIRLCFCEARHPVSGVSVKAIADGKTFVYTGDTNTNDEIGLFAYEADLLLADAGLTVGQWNPKAPHLSSRLCGELAAEANAAALLLTHIRPDNDPEVILNEAREAFPEAEIAVAGREYRV